jgi:hypothetical protein
MGGAGGSCFDRRPPKPHFHGNNLILLPININAYYPPRGLFAADRHAWAPCTFWAIFVANRGNLVRESGRYETAPQRAELAVSRRTWSPRVPFRWQQHAGNAPERGSFFRSFEALKSLDNMRAGIPIAAVLTLRTCSGTPAFVGNNVRGPLLFILSFIS